MKVVILSFVVLLASGSAAYCAGAATFVCNFTKGEAWAFEGKAFAKETANKLAFSVQNIDLARQRAVLVTGDIRTPVKIVRALAATHFLEVTVAGFLNITTIYKSAAGGLYPAVHSRHFGVLGQPIVSQYLGTCQKK